MLFRGLRQGHGAAAFRRDAEDFAVAPAHPLTDENDAFRTPRPGGPGGGLADDLRRPSGHRDPLELASREEGDLPSVGRPERRGRPFRSGQSPGLDLLEGSDPEPESRRGTRDERDATPVGRNGQPGDRSSAEEGRARGRVHQESRRTGNRRRLPRLGRARGFLPARPGPPARPASRSGCRRGAAPLRPPPPRSFPKGDPSASRGRARDRGWTRSGRRGSSRGSARSPSAAAPASPARCFRSARAPRAGSPSASRACCPARTPAFPSPSRRGSSRTRTGPTESRVPCPAPAPATCSRPSR